MDLSKSFLSRRQVRQMTGWSYAFIDRNLPRRKIGGKVLVDRAALERLLRGEADHAAA